MTVGRVGGKIECNRSDYFRGYGFQLRQSLLKEYFVKELYTLEVKRTTS
jgi:hypothetical protein